MQKALFRNGNLQYKCPACGYHEIPVQVGVKIARAWEWNGDVINPTVTPSVKHFVPESADVEPELKKFVCHYFIKNGAIEFCGDCTHGKSGQTLPLESYSEAEVKLHSLEQ